jgi:sec-independent protein translocase protein TatA
MPHLGPMELVIILVIVVVIFGAGRVGDLGGAIGRSIREFRGATAEGLAEEPKPTAAEPRAATLVTTRPCPSCNTPNPVNARFCGSCGASLTAADPAATR